MSNRNEVSSEPRSTPLRVVVVGGYGFFGTTMVAALAEDPLIAIIVAGRDAHRARRAATSAGLEHAVVDTGAPTALAAQLSRLRVDLVVDVTGAWLAAGYSLARAAIAAGASYIDIADCRTHVCGIHRLHHAARKRELLVAAGVSSVPALSAAVIDAHLTAFAELHRVDYGITASELTPGAAAVTSVLQYCGKSIPGYAGGRRVKRIGWQGGRLVRFPAPVGPRWLARCDIPDLELFPARYPTIRSIEFRAGVAMLPSMLGIWILSWLVRLRVLTSAAPLAADLQRLARRLEPLGAGRSGMYVDMQGIGHEGRRIRRRWHLLASHNDGSRIPALGAVALVRRIAHRGLPATGAMPAMGLLSLDDYLAALTGLQIECRDLHD